MAQQSQISLQVKSNSRINECCFVMLIILRLFSLTFTSTHTNCLIQLLKSVSIKPFVLTEAAHSTAAFLTVKLFFRKSLFYSTACRFDQSSSLVSGRRIIQRSKPLSTTSFNRFRSTRPKPPTGFNHHPASSAHSTRIRHQRNPQSQSNLLIYKNFQQRTAPEVVRIIGG